MAKPIQYCKVKNNNNNNNKIKIFKKKEKKDRRKEKINKKGNGNKGCGAFLEAQTVKNLLAVEETRV